MNFLFCSVGRRCKLLENFKMSLGSESKLVATDINPTAPALYFADSHYIVPKISDKDYIQVILDICEKEKIDVITTLIDPEIEILAANRKQFENIKVEVLAPFLRTSKICYDKYKFYKFLESKGIRTVKTYDTFEEFDQDYKEKKCILPVFVKPRTGSGSVGAQKVKDYHELEYLLRKDPNLIIQTYMNGTDIDADIYRYDFASTCKYFY